MKLTFEEKKLLYTYGCADLELTRKRLYEIAGLTVDPDQNKLVLDFCRKLEDETLADWYDQMFYFVRAEMECYTNMLLLMQDIEDDEDWGSTIFDESEEGELMTMFKLETMIYASEDGTSSVFTLNPALQKQLDTLASQHPEVCQRKARGEAGGVTYQVRGAALAIQPVRVS